MRTASTSPSLEVVRAHKAARDEAEVAMLLATIDWALEHEVDDAELGFTFGDTGTALGGAGCPVVSEFAVHDLALSLGLSSDSGATYLARALELRYRLPRLFARVVAGDVVVWKATKVVDATMCLPLEGAAHVDRALAPVIHSCSFAQIQRSVDDALVRFDPAEAERRRQAAAEHRHFDIGLDGVGSSWVVQVGGTLDLDDALDLEHAVAAGARELADLGCEESLDVRRAMAVGLLARGQQAFDLETRSVTIYAHLDGSEVGTVDNTHSPVLVEQIKQWCQSAGTRVSVRPVIDLNANLATEAYTPTETQREQAVLKNPTCVFPRCTRSSRRCDLDHLVAHDRGGPTESANLGPLCRRHHRLKTFSAWTYVQPSPGRYVWTSPTGLTYVTEP